MKKKRNAMRSTRFHRGVPSKRSGGAADVGTDARLMTAPDRNEVDFGRGQPANERWRVVW